MGAGLVREITSDSESEGKSGVWNGKGFVKTSILNYLLSFTHYTSICRLSLQFAFFALLFHLQGVLETDCGINFRNIVHFMWITTL